MASVGADPNRPQEVARTLGLRSGLAWKVCKVAQEANVNAAVPHIPGSTGVKLFMDAVEKAGAPTDSVEAARSAGRDFERMVEIHTGDRTTLEMMIGGMSAAPAQAEQNRKLAYQGNSGTWGVRAKAQMSLNILAPNADSPDQCDLAQVGGLLGFRRLRRDARWLLFRRERWTDEAPQAEPDRSEPLDPECAAASGVPLMRDFCSSPLPAVDVVHAHAEEQIELPPGPIGNAAAMDCLYGIVSRAVGPAYASSPGEYSELGVNLITPAEHVQLDVLVHRTLDWAMNPEAAIYSRLDGGALHVSGRRDRNVLPAATDVQDLGWGVGALATPLMGGYLRLLRSAFDRLTWDPGDFRAFRVTMTYPPIPAVLMLRSELPTRD
ncbi:MAG: hypothetical protein ACYTGR_06340 [Planctomycetota bacterium]|jgi:hypothetical protein